MTDDTNPYAAPKANLEGGGLNEEYWREGTKVLYIAVGSDLPARCVKCNAPAVTPVKSRKLSWHHGGYYFLILLHILIYAIVALIVRKKFVVSPGLCRQHTSARTTKLLVAWSLVALALIASWYAASSRETSWIVVAVLALLGAMVLAVVSSRIVYPIEISKTYARLKGFGEPFLASVRDERGMMPGRLRR